MAGKDDERIYLFDVRSNGGYHSPGNCAHYLRRRCHWGGHYFKQGTESAVWRYGDETGSNGSGFLGRQMES